MSKAVSIRKRKKRPTIFSKNKETIVMPIDNFIYFFGISLTKTMHVLINANIKFNNFFTLISKCY